MAELDDELKEKIGTLIDESLEIYSDDSIDESIALLKEAWDLIPEPKERWEEGFLVAHDIFETYFVVGEYQKAEEWEEVYLKCDEKQRNFGDGELYVAKTAFELDKLDKAKKYFETADKKSDGRVWQGEQDPKYFKFYKQK